MANHQINITENDTMTLATTAVTGPIVTTNEPIGNGGYTG